MFTRATAMHVWRMHNNNYGKDGRPFSILVLET